jgi:hypothetical protein
MRRMAVIYHFFVQHFMANGYFDYDAFKIWVLDYTGLPHSTIHIYMGVIIQLTFCALLQKRISHPVPLYFVCFSELINELHDALYGYASIDKSYAAGYVHDWLHTITVPVLLFLLARYTKVLGTSVPDEA